MDFNDLVRQKLQENSVSTDDLKIQQLVSEAEKAIKHDILWEIKIRKATGKNFTYEGWLLRGADDFLMREHYGTEGKWYKKITR